LKKAEDTGTTSQNRWFDQNRSKPGLGVQMKSANRSDIEGRAREVLTQHGLYALPIDPVQVANRLGISVNNAKFSDDSWAGLVTKNGSNTRIFVEQSDPPYRKRFSIAHELGHHFLHLLEDGEIIDKRVDMFREREPSGGLISEQRLKEIQANWFAAALLMPEDLVRAEWQKNPNIRNMARAFNVSEEAMGYRLDAFDLLLTT
jgi:Zn-dependent peptidase ImmA (M78 family)